MATKEALWAQGHDEDVEVNQRALIDKVLARYSGEFTVFRELLQNSDDARAKRVEIHFQSEVYYARQESGASTTAEVDGAEARAQEKLPDLKSATVHHWIFKNDGDFFDNDGWSRLKKIAEGNPNQEKIGAFGVGFYSLFSVTEEPWVTSGPSWMAFHWKDNKDQLLVRRGPSFAPEGSPPDPWTTIKMPLREPGPMPSAFDFTRFLASSITFMAFLNEVNVYFDDKRLVRITKDLASPQTIPLPRGLKPSSPQGVMKVTGLQTSQLDIQAEVMRWVYLVGTEKPEQPKATSRNPAPQTGGFFASLFSGFGGSATPQRVVTPQPPPPAAGVNLLEVVTSGVRLTIFTASVESKLDRKLEAEIQRSMQKKPPARLSYSLIYTGKGAYDASMKEDEKIKGSGSVFQGLRADLEGTGAARVYIGHATGQTTGLGGHMSSRFIPTVERESIDLVDRHVAIWNRELLYVGGFLARSGYEREMATIQAKWTAAISEPGGRLDPEMVKWFQEQALHAMKFFSFYPSTPSSRVSADLEAAFFDCGLNVPFSIISSEGIVDVRKTRLPDKELSSFLPRLPTLSDELQDGAPRMIQSLSARRMILEATPDDVIAQLQDRPLTESETVAFLKWWIAGTKRGKAPERLRDKLLNATVVSISPDKVVPLSWIKKFLNAKRTGALIPTDGPLPSSLLPVPISRNFDPDVLFSVFPWTEFTVLDWLKHIVDPAVCKNDPEHDLTLSPQWSERTLNVLARTWPNLSNSRQDEIVALLKPKACIPTNAGLKLADQAYFPSVSLFKDLPVLTLPSGVQVKRDLEKVLQALGVRKHVELQMVFDRMIKTGDWTIVDLVKYLTSVQSTLSGDELQRLKHTSAFLKEADKEPGVIGQKPITKVPRFKASELYEPTDGLRELGLPIIAWGKEHRWKASSDEAKFLFSLGLKRSPPVADLLKLAAGPDAAIRGKALQYLIDNFPKYSGQYDPHDYKDLAFIPAIGKMGSHLAKPKEVFSAVEWHTMGFAVLAPNVKEHAAQLGISENPPTSRLVALLEQSPPSDQTTATQWFQLLAGRIPEFSNSERDKLSATAFIPCAGTGEKAAAIKHVSPSQCYFSGASSTGFHSLIFTFVDFGSRANSFLAFCGTRQEPSVEEIVQNLLNNPREFFKMAGGRDGYQHELKQVALNRRQLSKSTATRLSRSAVLLASRRVRKGEKAKDGGDADDEDWDLQYDLLRPNEIVIADDPNAYQLFGDTVYSAPQDDLLEDFYTALGSRRLSSLVRDSYQTTREVKSPESSRVRRLILERLPLFLHEHSSSKMKVSLGWLQKEQNFTVETFGKLSVTKSLNYGSVSASRPVEASAVARQDGNGPIRLWLAHNTDVDMYEVSTSMCRCLFDAPKANDVLLFMTILSTDLSALKRRGYNVDRILRRQQEEREALVRAAKEAQAAATADSQQLVLASDKNKPPSGPSFAALPPPPPLPPALPPPPSPHTPGAAPSLPPMPMPLPTHANRLSSMLQNVKQKVSRRDGDTRSSVDVPQEPTEGGGAMIPSGPARDFTRPPQPGPGVTPQSNIDSNIQTAIKACSEERSNVVQTRQQMQMVKETQNEGYCDVSGHVGKLEIIGQVSGMKVFATPDVPERASLVQQKQAVISSFFNILQALCAVFQLPLKSLSIFIDRDGPLIAFNRNGSLFVNLRYYEAWHDADAQRGQTAQAYISWYFTLAHEIAHNLVQPHNSEHEFYFSSICEKFLPQLAELL